MHKQTLHNGIELHYQVIGNGPAVMLLHGFGETSTVWENQVQVLSQYKLIIPDIPGSGPAAMVEDMSMDGLANCMLTILNSEHIDRCVMIGHSMGGYITLAFAEKFEERLNGFGLFHSTAFADNEEKRQNRQKGIQFIRDHGAFAFLKTSIPNLYSSQTQEKNIQLINDHIASVTGFSDAALIAYYESMMQRPNRAAVLQKTQLPVFFILGKHDNAVPLEDGLQQCHLPRISFVQVLENAGHMGMFEMPYESNQHLTQYLSFIYQSQLRS